MEDWTWWSALSAFKSVAKSQPQRNQIVKIQAGVHIEKLYSESALTQKKRLGLFPGSLNLIREEVQQWIATSMPMRCRTAHAPWREIVHKDVLQMDLEAIFVTPMWGNHCAHCCNHFFCVTIWQMVLALVLLFIMHNLGLVRTQCHFSLRSSDAELRCTPRYGWHSTSHDRC